MSPTILLDPQNLNHRIVPQQPYSTRCEILASFFILPNILHLVAIAPRTVSSQLSTIAPKLASLTNDPTLPLHLAIWTHPKHQETFCISLSMQRGVPRKQPAQEYRNAP